MTPRTPSPSRIDDRGRDARPVRTALEATNARVARSEARLLTVTERLDRAESRLQLLDNTLHGVARTAGVSIGCPCNRCERSYLLVEDGMMTCPVCGFQQSF